MWLVGLFMDKRLWMAVVTEETVKILVAVEYRLQYIRSC